MRTIIHPKHAALEWIELLVPGEWQVAVLDDLDGVDTLDLYHETTEDSLHLSLASHLYVPGLLPPHLVEMAERALARISDNGPISGQRGWRVVPENYDDAPMDHTGAHSPYDVTAGMAGAKARDRAFVQTFSTWWAVGDQSYPGIVDPDYFIRPPDIGATAELAIGITALVFAPASVTALAHARQVGRIDARWWRVLLLLSIAAPMSC